VYGSYNGGDGIISSSCSKASNGGLGIGDNIVKVSLPRAFRRSSNASEFVQGVLGGDGDSKLVG